MASRGDPDNWSTKARRSARETAASEPDATRPLVDPLAERISSDPAPTDGEGLQERLATSDEPTYVPGRRPSPPPRRRRRVRPVRRVRRTIRHVDPLSVLKVSLMFYGVFLILWLALIAILYSILPEDWIRIVRNAGEIFEQRWELTLGFVEKWAFFIGLAAALIFSLLNLFLAFLYNVVADFIGGIDVTFVERDT